MAKTEKTTRKVATKKAEPVKTALSIAELRTKSPDELVQLLKAARNDLIEFRKMHAANELTNPRVLSNTRRQIARLNTILTEILRQSKNDNEEEK